MRKAQKQELLECINSLHQAHTEIRQALQQHNYDAVQNMLSECQEFAVTLGESIEKAEGEGHITVSYVEEYCEFLFRVFEEITKGQVNENRVYKILKRQLLQVENSVKNDIPVKKEIAFFPYKASMWDSLESVYLAAREDPECDAYCVPIPYYDLNPDRSFGKLHYEGGEYPENIEITDWQSYQFEERKPDVIYIHNPYDGYNLVTSVHPRYYSSNLKKYTETLVYIPYYVTSGRMMEAQSLLPSYLYVDYIVIQAPQFRECFDKNIPDGKFLPFGSPKVDKVINKCKNPSEPPEEWADKMTGKDGRRKKVFFYNTSINGMLADTANFLKKMQYVFGCFEGREDVCILWRPHPLLESTFEAMRPEYRQDYSTLKKYFIDSGLGIYDTTADIEDTIALCDAYIGDAGTSVTTLFGVAGKPVFILNNQIHNKPEADDWREKVNVEFNYLEQDRFVVTQGNKLYISEGGQYDYHYYCNLSDDLDRREYSAIWQIDGEKYACPENAQHILRIENKVEQKISLKKEIVEGTEFIESWKWDRFLILLPLHYPAIVRYDTAAGECIYMRDHVNVFVKNKENRKITGGSLIYQGYLYIASPMDNEVCRIHIESGDVQMSTIPVKTKCGCHWMIEYMNQIWILPYEGKTIVRWNPQTDETREYAGFPNEFTCFDPRANRECEERPFRSAAFYGDHLYLTPKWANMYLCLNIRTGQFTRWNPFFKDKEERTEENEMIWDDFFFPQYQAEDGKVKIYSNVNKRLYLVNMKTNECEEIKMQFNMRELEEHEQKFGEYSETLKYVCCETAFNSLGRFLDGTIVKKSFNEKKQLEIYRKAAANSDGSCGRKVYEYIKAQG